MTNQIIRSKFHLLVDELITDVNNEMKDIDLDSISETLIKMINGEIGSDRFLIKMTCDKHSKRFVVFYREFAINTFILFEKPELNNLMIDQMNIINQLFQFDVRFIDNMFNQHDYACEIFYNNILNSEKYQLEGVLGSGIYGRTLNVNMLPLNEKIIAENINDYLAIKSFVLELNFIKAYLGTVQMIYKYVDEVN